MFKKILNKLFGKKQSAPIQPGKVGSAKITPDQVIHEDELAREVISRCWNTGKIVIGSVDDDGKITVTEKDIPIK